MDGVNWASTTLPLPHPIPRLDRHTVDGEVDLFFSNVGTYTSIVLQEKQGVQIGQCWLLRRIKKVCKARSSKNARC